MTTQINFGISVIGTASLDVLHLPDGQTVRTAGGAGLYTALAAQRAGARAALFAPYPNPMPDALQAAARQVHWAGPTVTANELPRLEIEHYGGGSATLLNASWGAEAKLLPADLPSTITETGVVHIAALSSAQRQLDFLQRIKELSTKTKAQRPLISVGTYARLVYNDQDRVRQLFDLADIFFMNENEANGLFGSMDQATTRADALLFVTIGEKGVLVIDGTHKTHIPGQPAGEVDPTGAGDTFCGATLAGLMRGETAPAAASNGVNFAAQTVSAIGTGALIQ